ncbi:hypothetical protein [Spirosoma linguale]|uniref:Uncharacterized protein n=1 Tax=Spirosoma linguale (strain ATCC 33905 / DSM 74 / LMG 10896 / Claus 1) TaxID=504472 RepID=D2QVH0_SPILD|nr:hypothetical protein Slin_6853 [Spirosoma linguale DSM 74]
MIKQPIKPIPLDEILNFIRAYRTLEQMPLEDGFAHLRAISPMLLGEKEGELKELRQHFRNQWYDKERHFGLFYLNLSHYRQIYLLNHWEIRDWQDNEYIGMTLRNPYFRIVGRPPAKALQLHQLLKFFENHGINPQLTGQITLTELPDSDKRFGNSANWGDYILSLTDPEPLLRQLIIYEDEAGYDFEITPPQ